MSFSRVKAVAFDMDGTLLNQHSEVTEATKAACEALRSSGRKLLIASGRTYKSARLPLEGLSFDGYVCSNGATVFEEDGQRVQATTLEPETVIGLLEEITRHPLYYEVHDVDSNRWIVQEDRARMEEMIGEDQLIEGINLRRFTFYNLTALAGREELIRRIRDKELEIVKIFIWYPHPETLQQIRRELAHWEPDVQLTTSGTRNLEVIPRSVSKWEGLQYFCRKWGLSADEIMAFGDAENDLEILTEVGVSVAMENAPASVKEVARHIAGHHDEDGVARFIRHFVLKEV